MSISDRDEIITEIIENKLTLRTLEPRVVGINSKLVEELSVKSMVLRK